MFIIDAFQGTSNIALWSCVMAVEVQHVDGGAHVVQCLVCTRVRGVLSSKYWRLHRCATAAFDKGVVVPIYPSQSERRRKDGPLG